MRLHVDIVELLSNKEIIGGLEISDDFLRLVVLDKGKNNAVSMKAVAEEALRSGVVINGALKDPAALQESLQSLLSKAGVKLRNLIISVPDVNVFSKVFSFPKAITGEKLTEAMRVTAGFNLPRKLNEVYLDWETVPSMRNNELYLSIVPKAIIDPFLKVFDEMKMNAIALEPSILSLIRVIKPDSSSPSIIVWRNKNYTEFIITRGRSIRFIHYVGKKLNEAEISGEVAKLSNYYEAESEPIKDIIDADSLELPAKFKDDPRFSEGGRNWIPALGAALRGLLPRSQDTLISLMPIGTEVEYETEKEKVFARFLSDMMGGVAVVLAAGFFAVWILIASIQSNVTSQGTTPLPQDAVLIEERAVKFNAMVSTLAGISSQMPSWSIIFDNIISRVPSGITITNFSSANPKENISIAGVARNRTILNSFRRALEESPTFTAVSFPISNLDKITDIPYTATMRLKDPNILFNNDAQ